MSTSPTAPGIRPRWVPHRSPAGSAGGGTAVTMRLWRVSGGWTFAAGYRGAGCRFGSVQVSARWAGVGRGVRVAGEGLVMAAVEASVVADWTTYSFPPPKQEMGRVFYRYVRF